MARYQNRVNTLLTPDKIIPRIKPFLEEAGFYQKEYKGEVVWKKGEGLLTAPQFMKVTFYEGYATVEAWIKFAWLPGVYGKDMGLDGFMGWAIKAVLRKKVAELERLIAMN